MTTKYILGQLGENGKPRTIEIEQGTTPERTVEELPKLPKKVVTNYGDGETFGNYYSPEARAINEIIDYLQALTQPTV